MTMIPYGPLWCWVLTGADQMFFSQPTLAGLGPWALTLADDESCTARCQHETQYIADDHPGRPEALTPPIQCGIVASEDATGRWLCDYHHSVYWTCSQCRAPLAAGQGGYCSWACQEAATEDT